MRRTTLLPILLATALAGCGNSNTVTDNFSYITAVYEQLTSRDEAVQGPLTQAQIDQAMAQVSGPLILVGLESANTSALMTEIARNGSVITFASATRQVINLENGILRGTRGLTDDLMSTTLGVLPHVVASGSTSRGSRDLVFLNSASETYTLSVQCTYGLEGSTIVETCVQKNGNPAFENRYNRDIHGRVISSRQWLSPSLGYITLQRLR